jgi:hypothetical protein
VDVADSAALGNEILSDCTIVATRLSDGRSNVSAHGIELTQPTQSCHPQGVEAGVPRYAALVPGCA